MHSDEDIATAYHEGGHAAVVLYHRGHGFRLSEVNPVTIRAPGGGGVTPWTDNGARALAAQQRTNDAAVATLRPVLHVMLAGGAAEIRKTGHGGAARTGVGDDLKMAAMEFQKVVHNVSHEQFRALTGPIHEETNALVVELWPKIEAIAQRLLASDTGSITGQEAADAFNGA